MPLGVLMYIFEIDIVNNLICLYAVPLSVPKTSTPSAFLGIFPNFSQK